MIYHYKTGKAGLYDPPFAYLKDLVRKRSQNDPFAGLKLSSYNREYIEEYFASFTEEERKKKFENFEQELGITYKEGVLPW